MRPSARTLRALLACVVLWATPAVYAEAQPRAEVTCAAAADTRPAASARKRNEARGPAVAAVVSARPSARALRANASPGRCGPRVLPQARPVRVYLKHCVLLR